MSPPMKQLLETMCGANFINKNPDEAFQFLDYVVEVSRGWEEPIVKEPSRDRTMNMARASGVYTLPKGLDVQAKFATIMRRLDDLEAKGVQEEQIVNERVTQGRTSNILSILHIPTLIIRVGGIIQIYHGDEVIMASFSSKETDFRVIKLMGSKVFNHKKQDKCNEGQNRINAQTSQELADIRTTLSQLEVVITLRNGKEYEGPKLLISDDIPSKDEPTVEKNARNEKEFKKYEEVIVSKDKRSVSNHLPFPSAMQRHKVRDKTLEILEVLKQVKINSSLLDMIKQVPAYAKFLKDLCTVKIRLN
ncbi:hypothetical protein CK203_107142 [Vitis vinifera]|uniref:Uncharacterized protein n=1 Tax=Vitis vinifera TaxID=29760 RepID=A0A438CVL1_VITVI|nr:hypothetical protein CK203_107142 [Vitis vinifera]